MSRRPVVSLLNLFDRTVRGSQLSDVRTTEVRETTAPEDTVVSAQVTEFGVPRDNDCTRSESGSRKDVMTAEERTVSVAD